jgi:precorrin-2 dehydrogenase/sirohydrochlorin ferrochelatase
MPAPSPPYPVNLLLAGRAVLVVGGGQVAASKVVGLLEAEAVVHVVALEVGPEVRSLPVTWEERPYERGEVGGYRYAVACTDDPAVNQAVFDDGEEAGVFVNAADDPARCSATLPAKLQRGPLLVTVSTSGSSPALSGWLRDRLGEQIGPEYEALVTMLAAARAELAAAGRAVPVTTWRRALDSGMLDLIRDGRSGDARARLDAMLDTAGELPPETH